MLAPEITRWMRTEGIRWESSGNLWQELCYDATLCSFPGEAGARGKSPAGFSGVRSILTELKSNCHKGDDEDDDEDDDDSDDDDDDDDDAIYGVLFEVLPDADHFPFTAQFDDDNNPVRCAIISIIPNLQMSLCVLNHYTTSLGLKVMSSLQSTPTPDSALIHRSG